MTKNTYHAACLGCLAIVTTFLSACGMAVNSAQKKEIREVFNTFYSLVRNNKLDEAYDRLASVSYKNEVSKSHFVFYYKHFAWNELNLEKLNVYQTDEEVIGAYIPHQGSENSGAVFPFINENGQYKLHSQPGTYKQ